MKKQKEDKAVTMFGKCCFYPIHMQCKEEI